MKKDSEYRVILGLSIAHMVSGMAVALIFIPVIISSAFADNEGGIFASLLLGGFIGIALSYVLWILHLVILVYSIILMVKRKEGLAIATGICGIFIPGLITLILAGVAISKNKDKGVGDDSERVVENNYKVK